MHKYSVNTIAIIIALMCLAARPLFAGTWHLPNPGGPFKVGLHRMSVVDSSRSDPFADDTTEKRELLLWIYYPAAPDSGAAPMPYIGKIPGVLKQLATMLSLPEFVFSPAKKVVTHIFDEAPMVQLDGACPVLLFSHGIGIGTVAQNMTQFENLASHGYIVVSIGHTYETCVASFPDGRVVPADSKRWKAFLSQAKKKQLRPLFAMGQATGMAEKDSLAREYIRLTPLLSESKRIWTEDTRFVISALERLSQTEDSGSVLWGMDLSRIGIFGHSMGAMTALKTTLEDDRIRVCVSYDAPPITETLTDSIRKPILFMQCPEMSGACEPAFSRCAGDSWYVVVDKTRHFNFCDFSLWFTASPLWKLVGFAGWINGYRCEEIMSTYTKAFFDRYLRNVAMDSMRLKSDFPEVKQRFRLRVGTGL